MMMRVIACILVISFFDGSDCFSPPWSEFAKRSLRSRGKDSSNTVLCARRKKRGRKQQQQQQQLRDQQQQQQQQQYQSDKTPTTSSATATRRRHDTQTIPLRVASDCLVYVSEIVSDDPWWDNQQHQQQHDNKRENPYGARVWPSSLGIAQLLSSNRYREELVHLNNVYELGCGTGLVSQVVALQLLLAGSSSSSTAGRPCSCGDGGKRVLVHATDISPVALELTRMGWKETLSHHDNLRRTQQQKQQISTASSSDEEELLITSIYDICKSPSSQNFPPPCEQDDNDTTNNSSTTTTLLVASCVLYQSKLSLAMAKVVLEAYQKGIWIILGDDDAGYREEGRQLFMDHIEKLGGGLQLKWKHGTVQCPSLRWREKTFVYCELNSPLSSSSEKREKSESLKKEVACLSTSYLASIST